MSFFYLSYSFALFIILLQGRSQGVGPVDPAPKRNVVLGFWTKF